MNRKGVTDQPVTSWDALTADAIRSAWNIYEDVAFEDDEDGNDEDF
jgi:hypothetical protein